jgi:hypothetical protein
VKAIEGSRESARQNLVTNRIIPGLLDVIERKTQWGSDLLGEEQVAHFPKWGSSDGKSGNRIDIGHNRFMRLPWPSSSA